MADFKHRQLDAAPAPEVYVAFERFPLARSVRIMALLSGEARALAPEIRELVSEIDPTQPPFELQTLEQALSESIAPRRFNLLLLSAFAASALVLALVGIYGVISYTAVQRTHEIGVRLTIGVRRMQIVAMVVKQGMALALAGIAIGTVAAFGLTRTMSNMLYGVTPHDPAIFASTAFLLAATALLACVAPAFKAGLIDPLVALRHD